MCVTKLYCAGIEYGVLGSGYNIDGEVISLPDKRKILSNENFAIEIAFINWWTFAQNQP